MTLVSVYHILIRSPEVFPSTDTILKVITEQRIKYQISQKLCVYDESPP